jgi:hypothetical protein
MDALAVSPSLRLERGSSQEVLQLRQLAHVAWRRPEVRFELAHAALKLGA